MLHDKVAVITGSTSGIGLGLAQGLAKAGAHVVLNGFGDKAEIERVRAEIAAQTGVKVVYHGADMSKPEEVAALIRETQELFGSVDILVNNAGIQKVAPIEAFPIDKWDAIIAINLSSAFHTTRAAVPGMKAKRWGRIINIASAHALVASPFKSAYVAAKHGLLGLTKTVALELAEAGITCNAICPGYVRTPLLVEGQIKDTAKARGITEEQVIRDVMLGEQPTKRFVSVEELAALTVFLCGDGAASITGTALPVDGGWTTH
ncbi:MAG: 3-hydroxybutyrate dehydrogenase [Gammaproteobacteria bacterium]